MVDIPAPEHLTITDPGHQSILTEEVEEILLCPKGHHSPTAHCQQAALILKAGAHHLIHCNSSHLLVWFLMLVWSPLDGTSLLTLDYCLVETNSWQFTVVMLP